jgi:hypothetical protein
MRLPLPRNLKEGVHEAPIDESFEYRAGFFGYQPQMVVKKGDPGHGDFIPVIVWTHCRDIFQDVSDYVIHQKGMWFYHNQKQGYNVCEFVDKVEERISSRRKITKRTVFMRTPHDNILWIQPGPFWVNEYVRRSFFTLCLRSGQWYRRSKQDFDKAMYHYDIAKTTKPAVERFLEGFTYYTGEIPEFNSQAWQYLFQEKENVDHLLTRE